MLHKGFTERPDDEEGIKTAEREEHRTIFIGLRLVMTPTRRLVKFLFKPIKTSPTNSVFDPPYSNS